MDKLKYDGIYYYIFTNNNISSIFSSGIYLRFYQDGKVSNLFSPARKINEYLYNLLNRDNVGSFFGIGEYKANNEDISFQIETEELGGFTYYGKTQYDGTLTMSIISKLRGKTTNGLKFMFENISTSKKKKSADSKQNKTKKINFQCTICNDKFDINISDGYDVFLCKKCNSIFTYDGTKEKISIRIIKKGIEKIYSDINEIFDYFNCKLPLPGENELKKAYLEMIKKYHPDKVSNLGKEFVEIAEKKTKEINDVYSKALEYLNSQ